MFEVSCSGEGVYWLHWLPKSISLWSGLFFHMSHTLCKQFFSVFLLYYRFFVIIVVVRNRIIAATVPVSRNILSAVSQLFLSFQLAPLFSVKCSFFTVVAHRYGSVVIRVYGILALSLLL